MMGSVPSDTDINALEIIEGQEAASSNLESTFPLKFSWESLEIIMKSRFCLKNDKKSPSGVNVESQHR